MPPINPSKLVQRRNPTRPANGAALTALHALYEALKKQEGQSAASLDEGISGRLGTALCPSMGAGAHACEDARHLGAPAV